MNKFFTLILLSIFLVNSIHAQLAYIPSGNSTLENSTIEVVDLATNSIINSIEIGKTPTCMAIKSDESRLYVSNSSEGTVSVVDTESNTVIETIVFGEVIQGITLSPDDNFLYVLLIDLNQLKIVDLNTLSISNPIPTGFVPASVAASPNSEKVYFTNHYAESIGVLETATNTIEATIDIDHIGPSDILVSHDNSKVFVTTVDGYMLTIDAATNTVVSSFTTGTAANSAAYGDLALNSDGKKLHFYSFTTDELYVYDIASEEVIETILIGESMSGIDISPDGEKLVILCNQANLIKVINTENYEVEATISGTENPLTSGRFLINASATTSTTNTLSYHSEAFSVAPNPVVQSIDFSLSTIPSPALNYTLRNSLGQVAKSGKINSSAAQLSIETSSLSNGTYILSVSGEDWISSEKIILMKR